MGRIECKKMTIPRKEKGLDNQRDGLLFRTATPLLRQNLVVKASAARAIDPQSTPL
jgi:hypothetical protein